jgi:predicted dehydrogenase
MVEAEKHLPKNERMEVVAIVTPNFLHFYQAGLLLKNGFHVLCDKPITINSEEAISLKKMVNESGLVFCVTHTYTGYPMVRQMREMIKQGETGVIQRIDVQYYQGWVNPVINGENSELNLWRLDPKKAGISSCMGDIGVHAFNLVEYATGLTVKRVLSDLNSVKPNISLDLDGTVLLRLNDDIRGVLRSSQIANGEENNIKLAVYGSVSSLIWEQENPNVLYQLAHGKPAKRYKPGNTYNTEFAEMSHTMPFGHPEGYYEAFANIYAGTAKAIRDKKVLDGEFPTIDDGIRGMKFIESVVESNKSGNVWVELK